MTTERHSAATGRFFYEVNNRGLKLAIRDFNNAPQSNDPNSAVEAGDGFLFRRGYTMVWCGWIWELVPGGGTLNPDGTVEPRANVSNSVFGLSLVQSNLLKL